MSDEDDAMKLRYFVSGQPYEPWERGTIIALAEQERDDPTRSAIKPMLNSQTLRWDATVRAVEAERDAYKAVVDALHGDYTRERVLNMYRVVADNPVGRGEAYWRTIIASLELLPAVTP